MKIFSSLAVSFTALLIALSFLNKAESQSNVEDSFVQATGGGEVKIPNSICLTEEKRREIQLEIQRNIARLRAEGKLPETNQPNVVALGWPIRKAAGVSDFDVYGISNFVDHNPAFPNQITDYNCGTRSYDLSSGYNHSGTDIFTWPFGWYKMDFNEVEIIAAAPGTIVNKSNGYNDRSCGFGGGNWNAVYVRHADGSVAWYGHMKNNSLTSKNVGDTVAQGEYLGIVGSSGNSTGPHLHFELYNASNQLQDPYQGTCNSLNNFSWWATQRPYRDSYVNKLMTHSAPPVFPACPNQEIPNAIEYYNAGRTGIFAAYYRDQLAGALAQYSLIKPDGATHQTWMHSSPQTYSASYWFFNRTLPLNAQPGPWTFRAVFNSQVYDKTFTVTRAAFDFDADNRTDISVYRNGIWYLQQSTNGFTAFQFGIGTDKITPADYDGDAKTDAAVYRDGTWYILQSAGGVLIVQFGLAGDIPVSGDYDGDGKADIAVWRPSDGIWYILRSRDGFTALLFGLNGDRPVAGDYDGDGKFDQAVYRGGIWYILRSRDGFTGLQFGISTDMPVVGDYDGDAKTDYAVYRDGIWYLLRSRDGFTAFQFGLGSDVPTPADYDGDGKTDFAVFRSGTWYLQRSTSGFFVMQFGQSGDVAVPAAYLQ